MTKKIVWDWEAIDDCTVRVRVIGGWWVVTHTEGKNRMPSSIFIPDQHWEWEPIEPYVDPAVKRQALAQDFEC